MTKIPPILKDPRVGPTPPFNSKQQSFPGLDSKMDPTPDYGEESYNGNKRLLGRKAVITGGDSGIGKAVAVAFAREGADVLISYLEEEEDDAIITKKLVEEAGVKAVLVPGDIQSYRHCEKIIDTAVQEMGGIDILVNNAAYQKAYEDLADVTEEELDRTFRTNVFAMFYLCQLSLKELPAGSSIINVASIQAYDPNPTILPYDATKGAVVALSKGLAQESIKHGIRCNVVAPGPVWTPFIPAGMLKEKVREFGKTNPTGRPAQPFELAPTFVFLASNDSVFVNGEIIGVTGGQLTA